MSEYFLKETSVVDKPCEIGKTTKVGHFSYIMQNTKIGEDCEIGNNVVISENVILGNNVIILNNVSIPKDVICEDNVYIGSSCVFENITNYKSHINKVYDYKKTRVKQGASIAANSTIICGLIIGKNALVAAGSVVTKEVPDYAIVQGNPTKIIGWICECGEKLEFDNDITTCTKCAKRYWKNGNIVEAV